MPIWCKVNGLSDEIAGIKMREVPPVWQSSNLAPEVQLRQLQLVTKARPDRDSLVDWFRDYNRDEELAKLVKGKKIAYVCPSPHLKGKKMGKLIDSYDLVVRINQSYHMPEEDWEDYGSRTDILMNCLNINKIDALRDGLDFARSLKYIICPMVSMWDIGRVNNFLDEVGTPWHNVCDGYLFKVFKEVGTTCNSGLMGIITLLNYDIEELFVSGMTFFNMNTFGKVYYDNYHDEAAKYEAWFDVTFDKEPSMQNLRMDIHHQFPQIQYFNKIILKYKDTILKLDDYLKENFNLAYSGFLGNYSDIIMDELVEIDLFVKTKYKKTISNVAAIEMAQKDSYALYEPDAEASLFRRRNILEVQSSSKISYAIETEPWKGSFK